MTRKDRKPIVFDEDGREPWDQQSRESQAQYDLFTEYAAMPRRSVPALARSKGKSVAYLTQCAWAGRWRDRAEQRDRAEAEEREARRRVQRDQMLDQHLALARRMLAKCVAAVNALRPEDMKPTDISRMVDVATKLHRAALDIPDTTVAVTGQGGGPVAVSLGVPRSEGERVGRLVDVAAELARRAGGQVDPSVFDALLADTGTG